MLNYRFSAAEAKVTETKDLFKILIALIETQHQATRYRSGLPNTLSHYGICGNVDDILDNEGTFYDLTTLFFDRCYYPIEPYSKSFWSSNDEDKNHRWGDTETGNRRMAMLARMIKDLTHYLLVKA